jgi:hypothetical protein
MGATPKRDDLENKPYTPDRHRVTEPGPETAVRPQIGIDNGSTCIQAVGGAPPELSRCVRRSGLGPLSANPSTISQFRRRHSLFDE